MKINNPDNFNQYRLQGGLCAFIHETRFDLDEVFTRGSIRAEKALIKQSLKNFYLKGTKSMFLLWVRFWTQFTPRKTKNIAKKQKLRRSFSLITNRKHKYLVQEKSKKP